MAQQFEDLPYKFTRDELRQLGEQLALANQNVYTLRSDKKTTVASMEAAIKAAESHAAEITRKLNEKGEMRPTEVHYVMDTPRPGYKTVARIDTGEEIRVDPMTDEERQATLPFAEVPDGKTAGAGGKGETKARRSN